MLHPSPEKKVSSWVSVVFDIVSKVALVIVFILLIALVTSQIVLIMTPELDMHPYEKVK